MEPEANDEPPEARALGEVTFWFFENDEAPLTIEQFVEICAKFGMGVPRKCRGGS